ncbi:hypothetical protein B5C34_04675 [Pacificimonas flava]|uniref:Probable branched-chain-amino-acid aminotransferase n=2 Tax=Pacificimonas TaxID=1960290 RepID=A0A219B3A1_9SPHN|nr:MULTISPECIES: D-amino-acid transaminase [Pacificimonas]MBZ6377488.1 D-amino-acid transaminase [Pacificimonas aurantium]OWV32815.1 hypothetical protein B5C34_04675 [Pacificimonas flava]
MPRLAYVNGRIVPLAQASVSIEDRAYLFADGIYEVASIFGGALFDWPLHLERMARSLNELQIRAPMSDAALRIAAERLIRKSGVSTGMLYLQITRGAARRDHAFPDARTPPGLSMIARPFDFSRRVPEQQVGMTAITAADQRWSRRDIKSVALLPNVIAKQAGKEAGAYETIMIDPDGTVTEGSSTTVWVVDRDGTIVTRPLSHAVLPGLKRRRLIGLLEDAGETVAERSYDVAALKDAAEVFVTSTSSPVMPIVSIGGEAVGDGTPGPASLTACRLMWEEIERQTGWTPRAGSPGGD